MYFYICFIFKFKKYNDHKFSPFLFIANMCKLLISVYFDVQKTAYGLFFVEAENKLSFPFKKKKKAIPPNKNKRNLPKLLNSLGVSA